jgi:ribosome recycling factor
MTTNDILTKLSQSLQHIKGELEQNLNGIRSNRANPGMVEGIEVEVYGSRMKVRDVAHISAPEPRLIVVQPWDATQVEAIAKGLGGAGLGVSPVVDSGVIRLPMPPLTEERRAELVKLVKQRLEEARVQVRQSRQDAMQALERSEKDGAINEDEQKRGEGQVQKEVDRLIKELEDLSNNKEQEVMTV